MTINASLIIAKFTTASLILFHVVTIPNVASYSTAAAAASRSSSFSIGFLPSNTKPNKRRFLDTTTLHTTPETVKRLSTLIQLSFRPEAFKDDDDGDDDDTEYETNQNRPRRSKRRHPPDSRTATRWVIESIEKILQEEDHSSIKSSSAKNASDKTSSQDDRYKLLNILYRIPKGTST